MSQPITQDQLRETLREELNDRFSHFEKRQDAQHREIMEGFGQVIENVNEHIEKMHKDMDRRFDAVEKRLEKLEELLSVRQEFDHMATIVSQKLGVSLTELTGRSR